MSKSSDADAPLRQDARGAGRLQEDRSGHRGTARRGVLSVEEHRGGVI